jgi:energy-coupling factor transporter ATP-binding protein EcfA2
LPRIVARGEWPRYAEILEIQHRGLVDDIARVAELLAAVAREREATLGANATDEAQRRSRQLIDHLTGHVLPRARSLDAPLLVLLIGPTGAGKSSLLNALAGVAASPSGVIRPTTRDVVVVARPDDREALLGEGAALSTLAAGRLRLIEREDVPEGIALLDSPDVDSIEHANRELTDRLAEAADLGIFVTTATRYADRVPWEVLARARDRALPLIVVVNRMPADAADRATVLDDIRRLLAEHGVVVEAEVTSPRAMDSPGRGEPAAAGGATAASGASATGNAHAAAVDILAIPEGEIDPAIDGLTTAAVAPIRARIDALGADRDARRALAARALAGSLGGLVPLVERVADDLEHEAIEADALRRVAAHSFTTEATALREQLKGGSFLRAEALRQWQSFVGADEITRFFSSGIGKIRGTLSALIRGTPRAPVAEVRDDALADVTALARSHAGEAARRTATTWADERSTTRLVADDAGLWSVSPGFDADLRAQLEDWVTSIAEDVQATGGGKRFLAKGASVGVNAAGIGVMLATFASTGGITGAEVGVAAGTAFLNQKLLEALFGEAAMAEMIGRARARLATIVDEAFARELARYERLVPDGGELRDLAGRLRAAATEVSALT